MTPELKPCPFCGGTKLKIDRKSTLAGFNGLNHRVEQHTYSVRCNSCHARGGTIGGKVMPYDRLFYMGEIPLPEWATTDDALQNKAILVWNRRVNPLEDKKIRSCSLLVDGEPVSFSGEELLSILTEAGRLKKGKGDYNGT